MLTRELLRAIRQIVGAVELARHGHRRGLAAVRPRRDDLDGREPGGARGDQRAGREEAGWPAVRFVPGRTSAMATPRQRARSPRRPPSRGSTTSTCSTTPATSTSISRSPRGPAARPRARRGYRAASPSRSRRPARRSPASTSTRRCSPAPRHAAAAAPDAAGRLELVEADLLGLLLGRRFRLAFIALNTLFLLGDRSAQAAAVAVLMEHLEPGGTAVVDVWLPDAEDLARYDGRLILEYARVDPGRGRLVVKTRVGAP